MPISERMVTGLPARGSTITAPTVGSDAGSPLERTGSGGGPAGAVRPAAQAQAAVARKIDKVARMVGLDRATASVARGIRRCYRTPGVEVSCARLAQRRKRSHGVASCTLHHGVFRLMQHFA